MVPAMLNRLSAWYSLLVRRLVLVLAACSGVGIVVMMVTTCADVIMRLLGHPIAGSVDIVQLSSGVALACALPYTTAVKGHVAVEFFFHKLRPLGRIVVDTVARLLGMVLFGVLCWHSFLYGLSQQSSGRVTATLQVPTFWLLYVTAFACGSVVLVILHNLLHPGREMIKP
jgi:TRAP-type C4-dicarboxylate transport system permease small subunit